MNKSKEKILNLKHQALTKNHKAPTNNKNKTRHHRFTDCTEVSWREFSAGLQVGASAAAIVGLRGGAGAAGFSRGRPSLFCSCRTLMRKARVLRGKEGDEKRLHSGTKK